MDKKRKILLVDDSPIVRAVVVHALSAAGFDATTIDCPRSLDGALARETPDLLLVDATFPNITDDELVATVAKHTLAIPTVFFSDRAEAEVNDLVSRTGARGSVPKDGATLAERLSSFF